MRDGWGLNGLSRLLQSGPGWRRPRRRARRAYCLTAQGTARSGANAGDVGKHRPWLPALPAGRWGSQPGRLSHSARSPRGYARRWAAVASGSARQAAASASRQGLSRRRASPRYIETVARASERSGGGEGLGAKSKQAFRRALWPPLRLPHPTASAAQVGAGFFVGWRGALPRASHPAPAARTTVPGRM